MNLTLTSRVAAFAAAIVVSGLAPLAAAQNSSPPSSWEDVYDQFALRHLHVRLTEQDYLTIRHDETFDIKVPAVFWMDGDAGDARYNITIRRKSATPLGDKISYRVAFVSQIGNTSIKLWHNIKSLSLENGDDQDVVKEGLAWHLHRAAANDGYKPGLASWTTITLHVITPELDGEGNPIIDVRPQGVYLSVELPDKQFLRNRGVWVDGATWLYKQDDIGLPEIKESPYDLDSVAYMYLNYSPFRARQGNQNPPSPPPDAHLLTELDEWVNMDAMLRLGAMNAYTDNPDELFNKGKNFFWADYALHPGSKSSWSVGDAGVGFGPGFDRRRMYIPWDLDAAIRSVNAGVYGTFQGGNGNINQHPFQQVILNHPVFRERYNQIMLDLLDGPVSVAALHAFLDALEPVLADALESDPNSKINDAAGHFDALRAWVAARDANIRAQIQNNNAPPPRSMK